MNFELLPNEIILDIFSYIDSTDLLDTFCGFNSRLNYLLYHESHQYRFNFIKCSKNKFEIICQQHLSSIAEQVLYLNLEDCDETPGQIDLFLSYIPAFSSFTHLRSLKVTHVYSCSLLMKIINQLHSLTNLIRLNFSYCHCYKNQTDIQLIMNKIWSLPKVSTVYLDIKFTNGKNFCLPTVISTSIKCCKFQRHLFTYNEFKQLVNYTPHLEYPFIFFDSNTYNHSQSYQFLTLTNFVVADMNSVDKSNMILFLRNLSNLRELHIYLHLNIIDGYEWEQLIDNYLPKLKIFDFIMKKQCSTSENIEEYVDQLLNSFRSSFWIDKHKWFVRCFVYNKTIHLQTFSRLIQRFEKEFPHLWKSTNPNDDAEKYFHRITNIYYPMSWNSATLFPLHLTNINYLSVNFPIDDQFWSIVSSLDKLKSLEILSYHDSFQSQLQTLLDQRPNFINLTIRQSKYLPLQTSLFQCTFKSIRKLDLIHYNYQFDEEECLTLSQSPLGIQCEILYIQVQNHQCIITLIHNMINLKTLHVQCKDALLVNENQNNMCDEVIQRLKDRLPATCLVTKNFKLNHYIRIWIK